MWVCLEPVGRVRCAAPHGAKCSKVGRMSGTCTEVQACYARMSRVLGRRDNYEDPAKTSQLGFLVLVLLFPVIPVQYDKADKGLHATRRKHD